MVGKKRKDELVTEAWKWERIDRLTPFENRSTPGASNNKPYAEKDVRVDRKTNYGVKVTIGWRKSLILFETCAMADISPNKSYILQKDVKVEEKEMMK